MVQRLSFQFLNTILDATLWIISTPYHQPPSKHPLSPAAQRPQKLPRSSSDQPTKNTSQRSHSVNPISSKPSDSLLIIRLLQLDPTTQTPWETPQTSNQTTKSHPYLKHPEEPPDHPSNRITKSPPNQPIRTRLKPNSSICPENHHRHYPPTQSKLPS